MEVMDKRKKDRFVKGIALNAFVLLGCLIYIYVYIIPQYDTINATVTQVNTTINNASSLKSDGVNKDSFTELLNKSGKKKEIPDVIFTDPTKLNEVLKKPTGIKKDYLDWLLDETTKMSIIDKEITEINSVLGNIIPVFVNSSNRSIDDSIDNQVTLASFITYIEKDILGKYSLTSYAPIGISNITFPEKSNTSVNIGSFKITLDFKGRNSNILALIDAVQKSGGITIRNGKIIPNTTETRTGGGEKGLSGLSNLLITIDTLSLTDIPASYAASNQGSITLNFYVEGMDYQKILFLRSLVSAKFTGLQKSVQEKGMLCVKPGNPLCNETATANAIATIKGLTKNLTKLQTQVNGFKTVDVTKDIDNINDINTSLQTIEIIYLRNNAILEKAKKTSTTK
ncbi:hypothetical protein AUK10_03940 [Candidatus Gracilibacteria bacterium CG2_30_37_12]|nr:MAG: hypothetical protein AUK10_03940 [Candidatus Gracilibacteria bacterium CG2_30_37_12]